ncbi:MAG: arsenate reductase ArsC [Pseudomonas sp.]|uniref:arsenate reductase ArsC n=1 Tax=Pseudomonas sp. TaxID=306 RepID=UPI003BB5C6B6
MKVLFLCTANSCRSILSEALFNHLAPSGMRAYSAGSQPSGVVNPLSLQALTNAGIDTQGLASKACDAHRELAPDFVISVCGNAAKQECPAYFGNATRLHWGLDDPSEVAGDAAHVSAAFARTLAQIQRRLQAFIELPIAQLTPAQLQQELAKIGSLT